jgi:hypothetical protein
MLSHPVTGLRREWFSSLNSFDIPVLRCLFTEFCLFVFFFFFVLLRDSPIHLLVEFPLELQRITSNKFGCFEKA